MGEDKKVPRYKLRAKSCVIDDVQVEGENMYYLTMVARIFFHLLQNKRRLGGSNHGSESACSRHCARGCGCRAERG